MRRLGMFLVYLPVVVGLSGCCALFQTPETMPEATAPQRSDTPGEEHLTPTLPSAGTLPTEGAEITPTEPEPTDTLISSIPIAYAKDSTIWVYYPDTQNKFALTGSSSPSGLEGDFYHPKLSPSGTFAAFKQRAGDYIVMNLEDYSYERIPNGNTRLLSIENILGWDANNLLYVTRQIGACVFWQEPNTNITAVDILVYDPRARSVVDKFPLPQDVASVGNSTGVGVSPSGRYITGDPFYCGPEEDFVPFFVYDRQTGAVYTQEGGNTIISDNEKWLAELDHSRLLRVGPAKSA